MSATARFYLGFGIALAIVIVIAFFIGYRAGIGHEAHVIHARAAQAAAAHAAHAVPGTGTGARATRTP